MQDLKFHFEALARRAGWPRRDNETSYYKLFHLVFQWFLSVQDYNTGK